MTVGDKTHWEVLVDQPVGTPTKPAECCAAALVKSRDVVYDVVV